MNRGYKFTSKKQSEKGIMAVVLGLAAMVSFFAANIIAYKAGGAVDNRVGAAGFVSVLFALAGSVLGALGLQEREVYIWIPRIGTGISVISLICWLWIALIGMGYGI